VFLIIVLGSSEFDGGGGRLSFSSIEALVCSCPVQYLPNTSL
jgi:hypothetical protein